jgi:hypothetical protein
MKKPNLPALLRLQAETARETAQALEELADLLDAQQEQEPENETRPI